MVAETRTGAAFGAFDGTRSAAKPFTGMVGGSSKSHSNGAQPPSFARARPQSAGVFRHAQSSPNMSQFIRPGAPGNNATTDKNAVSNVPAPFVGGFTGREENQLPSTTNRPTGAQPTQGRVRPMSAMARLPTRSGPTNPEQAEFEQIKIDILACVKKTSRSSQQYDDCEAMLRRYMFSTETTQVAVAKAALLKILVEKIEELHSGAVNETAPSNNKPGAPGSRPGTATTGGTRTAWTGQASDQANANNEAPQNRLTSTFGIVERARTLRRTVIAHSEQNKMLTASLETSKSEIKRLEEETALLKMTLIEASHAQGKGNISARSLLKLKGAAPTPSPTTNEEDAAKIRQLVQRLADVEAANSELGGQVTTAQAEIDSLRKALTICEKERDDALAAAAAAAAAASRPATVIDVGAELKDELAKLKASLAEATSSLTAEKKISAGHKAALDKAEAEAVKSKKRESEMSEKIKALVAEIATLKAKGQSSSSAKEAELSRLLAEAQKAQKAAEADAKVKKLECDAKAASLVTCEKKCKSLASDVESAKASMAKAQKEAAAAKAREEAAKEEASLALSAAIDKLHAREAECKDLMERLRAAEAANKAAGDAGDQVSRLRALLTEADLEKKRLLDLIAKGEDSLKEAEARHAKELQDVTSRFGELEKETQAANHRAERFEREAQDFTQLYGAEKTGHDHTKDTLAHTRQELEELVKKLRLLSDADAARQKAEAKIESLQQETDRAVAQRAESMEDKVRIERKMQALLERCEILEAKVINEEKYKEESRDSERQYKARMKELYEMRIQEMELAKQEYEAQARGGPPQQQAPAPAAARPSSATTRPNPSRPSTASRRR